jgi:hypothetical protein
MTGHVYAIEFADGTIKVGQSVQPDFRTAYLALQAVRRGTTMVQRWISEDINGRHLEVEERLIRWGHQHGSPVGSHHELFRGLVFAEVVTAAESLIERPEFNWFTTARGTLVLFQGEPPFPHLPAIDNARLS